jgi:hypothetical protein
MPYATLGDLGTNGQEPAGVNTSWTPIDLRPYLDGTYERPKPATGMRRTDGVQLLYEGKEHAILGETESGKSWFCLASAAEEMSEGFDVLYIHFEEADPADSVERLLALGVAPATIRDLFHFVGPNTPITEGTRAPLLAYVPSLVVLDGVNEAMALHGHGIYEADGVAHFRRALVKPFTANQVSAVLVADHVTKDTEKRGKDAFGSVHKGNALDGSRIYLENVHPFGRGKKGMSRVYVTKDRPGFLRANGMSTKTSGKTYMGDLVVNDDPNEVFRLQCHFFPPQELKEAEKQTKGITYRDEALAEAVVTALAKEPTRSFPSMRKLNAALRGMEKGKGDANVKRAVDDLVRDGRVELEPGARGAETIHLVSTTAAAPEAVE